MFLSRLKTLCSRERQTWSWFGPCRFHHSTFHFNHAACCTFSCISVWEQRSHSPPNNILRLTSPGAIRSGNAIFAARASCFITSVSLETRKRFFLGLRLPAPPPTQCELESKLVCERRTKQSKAVSVCLLGRIRVKLNGPDCSECRKVDLICLF